MCRMFGEKVPFLIDSGASCSLIDVSIFLALSSERHIPLSEIHETFAVANGGELLVYGEIMVNLQVGRRSYPQALVVADLGSRSAILGLDFMRRHRAVLRAASGTLNLGRTTVLLHREKGRQRCNRVSLTETLTIPPRSMKVVEVEVGREVLASHDEVPDVGVVEGLASLVELTGLMAVGGVVSVKEGKVPVNLLNVHDDAIDLKEGVTVGRLVPITTVTRSVSKVSLSDSAGVNGRLLTDESIPEHIRCVLGEESVLTTEQKSAVFELVNDFPEGFLEPKGKTGRTDWAEHEMDLQGHKPLKQRASRLTWAKQEIADVEVEKMLADDIIEPSTSPWSSPIVLVNKKDGSTRFCIDYRRINDLSKKDAYPLPRIDETLETLGDAEWFCTMDLASGYWQIKMKEEDRPKTAFVTRKGLFQFKVMPFGLCNAPATFQRLIDRVLVGLQWEQCLVYLDDIVVFGKTFEQTLARLRLVMERLKAAGLKLKASKCKWFQKSVQYLGHIVSAEGIKCDPEKIETVKDWPIPKSVTQVRSFLGLASYYRKFIDNFAEIAHPLTSLTRKRAKFCWSTACQQSFETLKECLISAPVLAYPLRDAGEFVLDTDASNHGMGAVLSQVQNGQEKVIAYASRTLNGSQRNYCTTKKELLAVVTFVQHFRHYLYGRHFIIRTDHASLKWLKNFKDVDGMLARWLSKLDTYDYEMVHRKGSLHGNADGLSRKPGQKCPRSDCPHCETLHVAAIHPDGSEEGALLEGWSHDELREWQKKDTGIGQILKWLEQSAEKPSLEVLRQHGPAVRTLSSQWGAFVVEDGILKRKWYPGGKMTSRPVHQIVAPNEIKKQLLTSLHNSPTGGHLGDFKTLNKVRQRFYWVGYKEDVLRWCRQCDVCAQSKPGPHRKKAPMGHVPVRAPLERVAVDILGPLPKTENGHEYILILGDYFTKWTEAYPLKDHTAFAVAEAILENFISRFGVPMEIHSDQGREFQSKLMSEICKLLRINKTRTTSYNPKSDGQVERFNRTIEQMLKVLVREAQDDWDDHLPYVLMAYRASVHESTKCTPNLLMLNRETQLPIDLMVGNPNGEFGPQCPIEYVEWVRQSMEHAFEFVERNLKNSTARQKRHYDRGSGTPKFQVGDSVWRYYPPEARRKFGKGWQGPYLVIQKVSDHVYEIQLTPRSQPLVVHVDHLKKYQGPLPVRSWLKPNPQPEVTGLAEADDTTEATRDEFEMEPEAEATAIPDEAAGGHDAPELEPDGTNLDHISIPLTPTNIGDQGNTTRDKVESYPETEAETKDLPIQPDSGQASNSNVDETIRGSKRPWKPKIIWDPSGL